MWQRSVSKHPESFQTVTTRDVLIVSVSVGWKVITPDSSVESVRLRKLLSEKISGLADVRSIG